ncbi:MAG: hypothetical protein ACRD2C_04610 [Acidimicrobiales bacterium]
MHDHVTTTTRIPRWAIVLAVLFVWACLLGLLFLLVRRTATAGWVEVTVTGPGLFHATRIPVDGADAVASVHDQVNRVRSVVAGLGAPASVRAPQAQGVPPPSGTAAAPETPAAPSATFNESRSHWFDGTRWHDARLEIPPGATLDEHGHAWWDGSTWRPLP